jgi:hypothetical protein
LRRKDAFISRAFAAACLVALLCGRLCAAEEPALPREIKTEHYDLYVEGTDGKEVGKLVEGLYGELTKFFHAEPGGRLRVKILPNRRRLEEVLNADKVLAFTNTEQGLYSPGTRTAYLFVDPTDPYLTRVAILHECTHQFHFLSRTKNRGSASQYYTEGLAVHFSLHRWDGRSAQVGSIPDIATVDAPGIALRCFSSRHHGSFKTLATDPYVSDFSDYCDAWGLVSFLISKEPEAWQKWATALDHGATPESAWAAAFGVDRSDEQLSGAYFRWLQAHQQPWQVLSGAWQSSATRRFEAVAGAGPRNWATAVPKARVDVVKFSAEATNPKTRLGVAAVQDTEGRGFVGSSFLFVDDEGSVHEYFNHIREQNDEGERDHWKVVPHVKVKHPLKFDVELRREGSGIEVFIDGVAVTRLEGSRAGPEVTGGSATFSNVVTEMFSPGNVHAPVAAAAVSGPPEKKSYARFVWPAGTAVIAASAGLALWRRKRRHPRTQNTFRPTQSIKAGERPNDPNARLRVLPPRSRGLLAAIRRRTSDWRPTRLKEWVVGAAIVLFLGYFAYMPFRSSGEDRHLRDSGGGQYANPSSEVLLQRRIGYETAAILAVVSVAIVALCLARRFSWAARTRRRYAASLAKGICSGCGYDLTANVSGTCPECGTRIGQPLARPAPPSVRLSFRPAMPHLKK